MYMILITRPVLLAERTYRLLQRRNINSVIIPMLDVRNLECAKVNSDDFDVVIITSQNAVIAASKMLGLKNKVVYAVGDSTKNLLISCGFSSVFSSDGDCLRMIQKILKEVPISMRLLYISGRKTAIDLESILTNHGYDIQTRVVYDAIHTSVLTSEEIYCISNEVSGVLFYSLETAKSFYHLAIRYQIDSSRIVAFCISHKAAVPIQKLAWRDIKVAQSPDEDSIIQLLE
jgi:uroporphyrinogen-III synthase